MSAVPLALTSKFNWARFESLQAYYTLAARDLERDIVSMLKDQKVGLLVWSPLAGGLLSGKFGRNQTAPDGARRTSLDFPPINETRVFDCIDAMRSIAAAHGVSVAQIAIDWLLHQSHVTSVIVGAKRLEQLNDNIAATKLKLSETEMEKLNTISALPVEYPGWMVDTWVAQQRFPA